MRERVWGSPDVGRAPGCVRTQGMLSGSIWKREMWRGVATQVRTHKTHGTQEMSRLRQDATPTDQTQGPFLLMPFNSYLYDKRLIIRETMDDGSRRHMVYCFHCQHNWGPYVEIYTTTSTFIAHLRIRHSRLPSRETDFKEVVSYILTRASARIEGQSQISLFTLARGTGGAQAP